MQSLFPCDLLLQYYPTSDPSIISLQGLVPATIVDEAIGQALLIITYSAYAALTFGVSLLYASGGHPEAICYSSILISFGGSALCRCFFFLRIYDLMGLEGFTYDNRLKIFMGSRPSVITHRLALCRDRLRVRLQP